MASAALAATAGISGSGLALQARGTIRRKTASNSISTAFLPPLPARIHARGRLPAVAAPKLMTITCAKSEAQEIADEMREIASLERRWQAQVTDGKVKSLTAKEAGYACQLASHVLLDVRPSNEHAKASVKGSIWIPAFDVNNNSDPGSLGARVTNFLAGGFWSGQTLTKPNERFMPDVVSKIPKSENVIVVCQKGLRSIAVCEQMYKAGYRNLFWVNGGFETSEDGDFKVTGSTPLKLAGIGGLSEFLGWTDQQRAAARDQGLSYRATLFGRLVLVVLGADAFFVLFQQTGRFFLELVKDARGLP